MRIRVLAFARLGELLGPQRDLACPDESTVRDVWNGLTAELPELAPFAASTRVGVNGMFVDPQTRLHAGDELALLPPVGGG